MSELRAALEQAMSSGGKEEEDNDEINSVISPPENLESSKKESDLEINDDLSESFEAKDKNNEGELSEGRKSGEPNNEGLADPSSKVEKPPVGWTPEIREHWAKLPDNVRKQINKREGEVNKLLQDTSEARRLHSEFGRTVEPYRALMASQGVSNPLQAINGLLETAASLSMGNTRQKAERLAGLISHYGIDIETLDSVLSGEQQQQQQGEQGKLSPDIENIINQRLAPFEQERQRNQQEQQYQVKQRAANSVSQVSQKEFFEDVRMDMADILEMATKRNQVITMDQAYEKAVQFHPEIQKVMRSRQGQGELSKRQNAASGIHSNRGGVATDGGHTDLRSQLEANWNESSSGRS